MRTVRMLGDDRVDVVDVPEPEPVDDYVVVKVMASALCGTEKRGYHGGSPGGTNGGHEGAGVVWKTDRPRLVREGDRVGLLAVRRHCGRCRHCLAGHWVLCQTGDGELRTPGCHSEYVLVREDLCMTVPEDISFEQASLFGDALGTPYRALSRLGVTARDTVYVSGQGPLGLAATMICRLLGATVIAADINAGRLATGAECGAQECLVAAGDAFGERLRELAAAQTVDVAIDCSGSAEGRLACLEVVRPGGRVAFVGLGGGLALDPAQASRAILKETTLIGSWYSRPADHLELIELVRRGLQPERMITHRYGIEDAPAAFATFFGGVGAKTVILPHETRA